ncbi:hypothetical protein H8S44_11180 [Anaerosacchariphilus sp. NSJ-68]|uniref:Uncharacterized protein n=2 Tax=Lachnospiraceae TaxID=186803 RepID=A0A923LDV4_9FIRM|nr:MULTISPECIES: DUF6020 family protein [Lachnospiraceae]MBC5660335.1 hypothetical protein [Anaerosacchariphilus hominis]MBC5697817.1 hypothetical protein [Roseburia difficilis]
MRKQQITRNSIAVLAAFLALCGINFLYQIRGESTMLSNSVTAVLMFGAFSYVGAQFLKKPVNGRLLAYGAVGGVLFAALTSWGFSLNYTDTIWNPQVLPAFAALSPFFTICVSAGLRTLAGLPENMKKGSEKQGKAERKAAQSTTKLTGAHISQADGPTAYFIAYSFPVRKFYWFCFAALFLSWVPVLLASWPGIFSYDCGWQLAAVADDVWTAHHPVLHTAMLWLTRELGRAMTGSNQTGALLYSLLQMVLMSALYADVCLYLRQKKAPKWLWIGALLFLGFHPVNSLMALCATKDSIFTAIFAVFVVQLLRMAEYPEVFFASRRRQLFFCVNVFFLFAFRNNGFHTFLFCIPFLLWAFRRYWKKMLLLCVICLGLYGIYTGPVYSALGITPGDAREMCSVLMQSAARVYNLDQSGLTGEQKEGILSMIDEEGLNSYMSRFADPVKAYFHGSEFAENPMPFLKTWISVGMSHKKMYIDSFLAGTFGYWYPGNSIEETDRGKDYFEYDCKEFREDVDVTMESRLPALSEFYRKIGNEASFQKVPVIAATFNLGVYTWLWLFIMLLLLYGRQWKRLIVMAPFTGYFLTNLLGPVVKMRYHYPFIACAPLMLYLGWCVYRQKRPETQPESGMEQKDRSTACEEMDK